MQLSVRDLRQARGPVRVQEDVELPRIAAENPQVAALGPVHCDVEAEAVRRVSHVHGRLHADVTYGCSRCLERFVRPLQAVFDESFTDDPAQAGEQHTLAGETIELDPLIEEAVNLRLETYPLCSQDCKGLCPVCGGNRNLRACDCQPQSLDPRLAALQDLLSGEDSK
ncbi:MAG: DUF177 domain-containing protein [Alicyclobacillus sp.]|nr:DUF177 domain-containing protein [Alicyclobacillus sp.]